MAIETLEIQKTDFDHTLGILSQGDRWYVYIDDPKQWWRIYDSLDRAMTDIASTLERLLVHEQGQKIKYARHPLANNGAGTFPSQEPRWRVRVTADCGEEQAEWHVEMLDDSAWLTSGYDLKECLGKLGRRLVVNSGPTSMLLPQPPKTTGSAISLGSLPVHLHKEMSLEVAGGNTVTPTAKTVTVPSPLTRTVTTPISIEDMMTARLEAIGSEIAAEEIRLRDIKAEAEKRLVELRRERRALSAARSAYRDKTRTK